MRLSALLLVLLTTAAVAAEEAILAIPNGGFEAADGWTIPDDGFGTIVEEGAAAGRRCLRIVDERKESGSNITSPRVAVESPGLYAVRGRVRPISGDGLGVYVRCYGADGEEIEPLRRTFTLGGRSNEWAAFEGTFVVPESVRALDLWIHSYNASRVTALLDELRFVHLKGWDDGLTEDMRTIKQRLVDGQLGGSAPHEAAAKLRDSLQPDGTWPDIDYADDDNAGWNPIGHVDRLLTMARAWRLPDSPLAGDAALLQAIWRGYDAWVRLDPQSRNWWYNQIGVPRTLYRAMLLLDEPLNDDRRAAGLRILERAKLGMTGQNLVWVAECTIARGCLAGDPWPVAEAFERIAFEARITPHEGVQVDGSFWQHGAQLYNGGYGKGFSVDTPHFAKLAHGTSFAFGQEPLEVLALYLLDGQQWMVRAHRFDYSACGREIVRRGAGNSGGLLRGVEALLAVDAPRRDELEAFAVRLREADAVSRDPLAGEHPLVGNKHLWRGDLMSHHRPGYYSSVRLTSERLTQTEVVNDENLLGRHLADGVHYLYRTGREYEGLFPVWDWQRLPGITAQQTGDPSLKRAAKGARAFAGGVSDGLHGVAAMDFQRDELTARKAWFFFDDAIVSLGAGIACPTDTPVLTSIEQAHLTGDVRVSDAAGARVAERGRQALTGARWLHHGGVGYVFPEPTDAVLQADAQTGSWRRISRTGNPAEVTEDVFSLWLDHGAGPANATYAYIVAPGLAADAVAAYAADLPVAVLSNTPDQQVVRHRDGIVGVVFHTAGTVDAGDGLRLTVDQPCLLLWSERERTVAVSNPENEALTVNVTAHRATAGDETLRFELPDGLRAGESVVQRRPGRG